MLTSAIYRTVVAGLLIGFAAILFPLQTTAQTLTSTTPIAAVDYPKRKAGLWQIKASGLDQTGMPATQLCVGEETDSATHHMDRRPGAKGSCSMGAFKPAQGGWFAESTCKEGKTTVRSQAVLTGDLASEYRIDTLVTYAPPLAGIKKEDQDSLVARYLGACGPSQKPGDLVVPGMGTLNLQDGGFKAEPKTRAGNRNLQQKNSAKPSAQKQQP